MTKKKTATRSKARRQPRRETRGDFTGFTHFAPIGYVSLDAAGDIVDVNPVGAALFAASPSALIGRSFTSLIDATNRDDLKRFMVKARRSGTKEGGWIEVDAKTETLQTLRVIARTGATAIRGPMLVALVEMTKERRLERDNRAALVQEQARAAQLTEEIADRTHAEANVKALLERVVTAQEEERRRIARNLHDHLGQQLTALRLTLDAVNNDTSLSDTLRERIAMAEQIVAKLDRDVDLLAWDLRPATLDDVGLPAALQELVRQWSAVSQVTAEFHQSGEFRLPTETASNLYRIVQEALNNIAKHAAATHVSVLIEHRGHEAAVIIEDNGRGFDPDKALASRDRAAMGLLSMRERAALIDAVVQIESVPGQGTTVFIRIPINAVP